MIVGGHVNVPEHRQRDRIGVLVDKTGMRALGTFVRRRDGRTGAPNVYVEGQYFYIDVGMRGGPDDRVHAYADIEQLDLVPIEP